MERQAVKIVRPARKGKAPLRRRLGGLLFSLFRFCVLFGLIFLIVYPFLFMFVTAFRGSEDLNDPSVVWITRHYTLNNFHNFLQMVDFGDMMGNTVVISLSSAVLQTFVCGLAGYGFARFRFKGNAVLFVMVILTIIVPPQMLGMPNYLLMKNFDFFGLYGLLSGSPSTLSLVNSPLSFFLPAALGQGLRAGVFILVFRQVFAGLPHELEEAAFIDGCGYWRTFFRIMLPNALTSIVVFFLFSLVWYWGDYYLASVNLSSIPTLATTLSTFKAQLESILPREQLTAYYMVPLQQAACVFSISPLILLFIVGHRFFVQGIDRSGIVG